MKAEVIASLWIRHLEDGGRQTFRRGATIDVTSEEFKKGEAGGLLREPSDAPLPPPNWFAADPRPTQPDGTPLDLDAPPAPDEFKNAGTHAEADATAASYGITFPDKTKLADKNEALRQVAAARAAGEETPVSTENLADLSDEELVQRGVDYGHTDDEMAELSHDELVLFVAEAMGRQGSTEAAQRATVDARNSEDET